MNFDICNVCGQDAEEKLVCCSSCPRSYHQGCAELVRIPKGVWHCPVCATRDKKCTICDTDLISSADARLVKCGICLCLMHFDCVEVPQKLLLRTPKYWHLKEEEVLSKKSLIFKYICYDCQRALGAESILDSYNFEEKKENALVSNNYYFIKFKMVAYLHSVWVKSQELKTYVSPMMLNRFEQRIADSDFSEISDIIENDISRCGIHEEYLEVEKVIDKWIPNPEEAEMTEVRYLVKWRGLQYENCTWEREEDIKSFKEKIEKYEKLRLTETRLQTGEISPSTFLKYKVPAKFKKLEKQPGFIKEGELLVYQLEGLNWMLYSWFHNTNVVLADEMGLGKTVECLVFLRYLNVEVLNKGPFLICAPLSTIDNWSRECGIWFPEANVVAYVGTQSSRELIRKKEIYFTRARGPNRETICKFNILLTSYEILRKDKQFLKKINWRVLVVDEGHKIKSKQSKIFNVLQTFQADFRLLMTGTPLQNNLSELFTLMQFISPNKFTDEMREKTLKEFEEIKLDKGGKVLPQADEAMKDVTEDQEQLAKKQKLIDQLHEELKPHMLRRMKKDVLPNLPKKKEVIVRVELTTWQKQLYKCIFTRNFPALKQLDKKNKGKATVSIKSLTNILMMLRLCANHGLLLTREFNSRLSSGESFEKKMGVDAESQDFPKEIITESGKMELLDMMLKQLKVDNHKVLIFSQFKIMLDLIEEYLNHKSYKWLRLDGGTPPSERQKLIDSFNEDPSYFVFLLSTRAGGLGINLAAADTVIIYDSDFNPHNDIQALSRAHRIGQKHVVMMYRLVSKDTVEEKIIELAKKKLMIEHLVVKNDKINSQLIDKILRYGTEKLFNDSAPGEQTVYTEEIVKKLLDRSQAIEEEAKKGDENEFIDDYLSKFNIAQVPAEEIKMTDPENFPLDYWTKLLKEQYDVEKLKEQEMYGKGKRKHNKISYGKQCASEDDEWDEGYEDHKGEESSEEPVSVGLIDENMEEEKKHVAQKRKKPEKSLTKEKLTCASFWESLDIEKLGWSGKTGAIVQHLNQASSIAQHLISSELYIFPVAIREGKLICTSQDKHEQDLLEAYQINLNEPIDLRTSLSIILWGFHELNRRDFVEALMKFGISNQNWKELYERSVLESRSSLKSRTLEEFENYAQKFSTVINDLIQSRQFDTKVFFTGPYSIKQIVLRNHRISLLKELYRKHRDSPKSFTIDSEGNQVVQLQGIEYKELTGGRWTNVDDFTLVKGSLLHGYGSFKKIMEDNDLWTKEESKGEKPQAWKILFDKISDQPYAEVIKTKKDPGVEPIAKSYVEKYLITRLRFILEKVEKSSAKVVPPVKQL
eukprot:TRINITY_DN120141_c0_g1_i1.p1 TRINITY_DN120141_c0_g1~~TRINITY_DN120141_c0_g1_i1.p1  ORF type:complete len:1326 (+),score=196.29 TRINITY_DN120141_c0_g1_i1:6098-10075(+)